MFDSNLSIGCCCCIYLAIVITSMILFGLAYSTVDVGNFAILQNRFSKNFDNDVYYSGRYYTGIAKNFITYPMMFQLIIFGTGNGATGAPITSNTASGSSISIACIAQYVIRPENILQLYVKWPQLDRLRSDLSLSVKQIVQSTINQYTPTDFRSKRSAINTQMSYQIGTAMKNNFYCDLNLFTISQVILSPNDLSTYLQAQVTAQNTLLTQQTQLVNTYKIQISSLISNTSVNVTNITAGALANATIANLSLRTAADSSYTAAVKTSWHTVRAAINSSYSSLTAAEVDQTLSSFFYFSNIISQRQKGTLVFGFN